jgi:hypothetical protein
MRPERALLLFCPFRAHVDFYYYKPKALPLGWDKLPLRGEYSDILVFYIISLKSL